jgi:hypothetical protein
MRRTGCEGGSPRVRYTTARFRHPAWRRRGGVAARGTSAAGCHSSRRISVTRRAWDACVSCSGIPQGTERSRLCRGQEPCDRISLGAERLCPTARIGSRLGESPRSCDRRSRRHVSGPRSQSGYHDNSDRVHHWLRPRPDWPRRQSQTDQAATSPALVPCRWRRRKSGSGCCTNCCRQ